MITKPTKPPATTKKQAFINAGINSLLHIEENTKTIKAYLFMCPIDFKEQSVQRNHWSMSLGRNRLLTVKRGRIERSKAFLRDKQSFMLALWYDLKSVQNKARETGKAVTVYMPESLDSVLHGITVKVPTGSHTGIRWHYPEFSYSTYIHGS